MINLQEQSKDIRVVVYAPDGRLVSGGSDKRVRIWDPLRGECQHTIKAPNIVYALAISPDGKTLAYAGRYVNHAEGANTVCLWNLINHTPAGEYRWQMGRESYSIWTLSFSADGNYLAAACRRLGAGGHVNGGGGHWWRRNAPFAEADFADSKIYSVGFAPSGSTLALTMERSASAMDGPAGPERLRFKLQSDWAAAIAFIPPDDTLVVASSSKLQFVATTAKSKPKRIKTSLRSVTSLAVSQDGRLLIVGGKPAGVEVYDLRTMALDRTFDFGIGGVHGVAIAPDGLTFAVAGDQGLVVADME